MFNSIVDTSVIQFEEPSYEVIEDVGLNNLALRVCFNISNLNSERTVRLMTVSGSAQGMCSHLFN